MRLHSLLSERPIAYYPVLRRITGSITAAIMLQQLLYWWDRKVGDEIYKTVNDMESETGLSEKEQRNAVKLLKQKGFIDASIKGIPPVRHFVVYTAKIDAALEDFSAAAPNPPDGQIQNRPSGRIESAVRAETYQPDGQIPYTETTTETTAEITTEKIPPLNPPQGGAQFSDESGNHTASGVKATSCERISDGKRRKTSSQTFSAAYGGHVPREWLAAAIERGLTPQDAAKEAEGFQDYWTGTKPRTKRKRWKATWMQWIRKHPRYRPDASIVAAAQSAAAKKDCGQTLFDSADHGENDKEDTAWAGNILSDL